MIGSRLAHYEITSHLGSGGMGDVYQATDAKLGRKVAIKVLPEAFARDADRAARFEREARVLASLNHPHIAAIYGLEDSLDGAHVRKFLVMELAHGETLAQRITKGPLPLDEALRIAAQIAEALESAHENGVVHRDLKPANIKVSPDGQVKVLDFGLAKAFFSDAVEANFSNSPTLSLAATNAGVIMGTAAYMSPEQAKGMALDRRTDIFSFGAVLYEMLIGRPAFEGDSVTEILAGVIKAEPDWSRLPKDTPSGIRRLLERSLRKERNRRLQTAADVLIELEEQNVRPERPIQPSAAVPRKRERLAWIAALAAAVALTVTVTTAYFRASTADAPETRLDIVTPATSDSSAFAISPDGRHVVFLGSDDGNMRLWIRPLDSTTAQPLAGTDGALYPFWSPDSKSIGFFAAGNLKRIDIGGGLPQVLANAENARGGAWNSDGIILFAPFAANTPSPLFRIPASGGEAVAVTKLDPPRQTSHRFPEFLPNGRQFLFYSGGSPDASGIYIGSLDSPETKHLTAADTAGVYVLPGWLLYIRQGALVERRFDPSRGELTGDPVTVADRVPFNVNGASNRGAFSVSAAGLIAYRTGGTGDRRQLTWFDRTGKILGTLGALDDSTALVDPVISRDGRRVIVGRTAGGNSDLWLMDETRGLTRFTFDAGRDISPSWSPDGTQIAFSSNRKGVNDIYIKPSSGAGNEEIVLESSISKLLSDWSPDGQRLLLTIDNDLLTVPLEGERKPQLFLHTEFPKIGSRFSPDGRWISYQTNESERYEIYVRPFPGPGGVWQISSGGGISARWRPDGKEIYYIAPDGKLMAASIGTQGDTLIPGAPVALFQTQIFGGGLNTARPQYAVAPDGRFLINVTVDNTSSPITLLQNWKPPAN